MDDESGEFQDPYIFKITFECLKALPDVIEWKLIYVGSAEDPKYDQELDVCEVGPVPMGINSFEFEAAAPDPKKIPPEDLLGVTVMLLTASHNSNEFLRVGYYVTTEYDQKYLATLGLEPNHRLGRLVRHVLVTKPRVTRINITW